MMTYQFHFPASSDATLMITLPEALRGEPLNVVVAKEPAPSNRSSIASSKKGILGLRGILKGYTTEELENAHNEYLTEKYIHD